MTNRQRPYREQDPRVRRSFARVLIVSGLAVVGALAVVGVRVQQVQLAYRLDALRAERAQTERRCALPHDSRGRRASSGWFPPPGTR